jgi:putative DNA primase/helicase
MNRFAPLNPEDLSAATVAVMPAPDDGELALPVPADAPPPPRRHPSFGAPTMVWPYRDASGGLLCEIHRYDPVGGRKQFLPATCWRRADGEPEWRWKSIPSPRPLYGLDRVAANPGAPVIVTEGEKSAEAAARVFPKSVCVTSLGGSQAAGKADWKPLAGRRVLIWPDADEPGAKYAIAVAEILHGLGCEVSIVDAMGLASMSPDGETREALKGWDAADAVDEWQDLAGLRKTAINIAKPYEPGPAFISYSAFTMGPGGLTTEATKGRGQNAETVEEWISGPFEILGATRDPNGRGWGKWLRWRDGDKREHFRHVSDAALQGDPAALCATLADEGLRINRGQQRALVTYLSGASVKSRVTIVSRTGWHSIAGREVFVLPGETIGPCGVEHVIIDVSAAGPYEARGTLQDWRNGVGMLASGHALPVLAISAALAGPLLRLAGHEGGGLNFFGPSSKGKTTLLQLAASAWGKGASSGYVRAWRATANGLEGAAASATDTCLVLDELGQVEARDAAAALYSLSNGTGKARAARDGALREPKSWRALILSSGEIPTETKLREDKSRKARAGQLVRMLDIPADRGFGFGAFDNRGPDGDSAALAKAFKASAISAYGTAGPEFVRRLISNGIDGDTVRAMISKFVASAVPAMADGQIDRAAARLGLIAAAGELATAMGLTPWSEGEARTAAAWALKQWIDGRGGTEPAEIQQAIEQVRLAIEQHGEARFESVDDSDVRPVANRLGWRKGSGADREWWIPSEIWKSEICSGLDPKLVARALGERGMLERVGDGWQPVRKVAGANKRVYVVTANIFDGGADAS